jgi:hypothetical protein
MDDLKSYVVSHLLWNADADVDALVKEFTDGVYGKGAPYIREYLRLFSDAVAGQRMTLYDHPDAPYLTDELIEKADSLFARAEEAAENDSVRARIAREHLSIRYLLAVRLEDDDARSAATDALARDIRAARLTEIMERRNLYLSFEFMKRSRYAKDRTGQYNLYYVVK